MKWNALLVVVASAAITRSAAAAPGPMRAMSLREALDYAHAHQPILQAAVARLGAIEHDADVTRARWKPTFLATAQLLATTTNNTTGSYLGVNGFDNPRVSATRADDAASASLVPSPSSLIGIGARQEVYDFGRIAANAAADDLRTDAQRFSVEAARLLVDYDVAEAYFAVGASKGVLAAAERAIERETVHRDMAKAGVDSGLRRPIELTRAEAELERYQLQRIHAQRDVGTAQSVFAAAVGVSDPLLDSAGEAPAPRELPTIDDLAHVAANNPDVRRALTRIREQEERTRAVGAELRPNLFLSAAITANAGGATPSSGDGAPAHGLLPTVPNWDAGLVFVWPLFDATVSERAKRARAEEDTLRSEASVIEQRTAAAIEQAYLDAQAARDAVPVLQRSAAAAIANYDQANARFGVGLGNAVELADAEELRTTAEIQLALGTFEFARARAALGRVIAEGL